MINPKEQIYSILSGIAGNVTNGYPDDWTTFPVISYIEEEDRPGIVRADGEAKTYYRYKIDIWTDGTSTTVIASEIKDAFAKLGWQRKQSADVEELTGLKHKVIRFECQIDINGNVYNA